MNGRAPHHIFPRLVPLFPHLHPVFDARSAVFPPKPANFHRRGAFQAFLCATPRARRYDAHAGAFFYMYVKALTLRYSIWGTPRVIRNEKRQNELPRASADSTPILTDQQPSSGLFGQTMVVRVSRRVGNTSKGNICRPESLPLSLIHI